MVQKMLQTVVQTLKWTYSLFWQLCPKQGVLVWADGCYNGTIRTRKVVQPSELAEEEARLQRSQQLRELYESLTAGEDMTLQPLRGPCAALSPEDLTETEWFYLVCMSFSFPPGSGLPGKAYQEQQPIWLSRANDADRNFFSRVLLAKSAQIQTILCIPLENGVLELGTIDRVEEDLALIHRVRSTFTGLHGHIIPNTTSAITEPSTSEPNMPSSNTGHQLFHLLPLSAMHSSSANVEWEFDVDDEADDYEDIDTVTPGTPVSDYVGAENINREDTVAITHPWDMAPVESTAAQAEPAHEPRQIQIPQEILMSYPEHISDNLRTDLQLLPKCCMISYGTTGQSHEVWPLDDDATDINSEYSGATRVEYVPQDDAHYYLIIATIRRCNLDPNVGFGSDDRLRRHPRRSAFIGWTRQSDPGGTLHVRREGKPTPQRLLRHTLCRVPYLYGWCRDQSTLVHRNTEEASSNLHRCIAREESSTSHVLAERKRREKLNERFLVLKSLVPVTKMDKASILGDTIEYIKQLLRRIQEYEIQMKLMKGEKRRR